MKHFEPNFLYTYTTLILIVVLLFVAIYLLFFKKKSRIILAQQIKDANFEYELAISLIEIKEQTLNYIGHELHEDVGQKLSVARLLTNKIAKSPDIDKNRIVNEINLLIGECIQDIRNLSTVFITRQVEQFAFVETLEKEIVQIERLQLITVDYRINNYDLEINADRGLILFRLIQECINNVIKYSKSKKIQLIVNDSTRNLEIEINDEQTGFYNLLEEVGPRLLNLSSRAKIINAELKINSIENFGTKISIIYNK